MTRDTKPVVSFESTFDKLDIRLGRIVKAELETRTTKPSYRLEIDFGKFGKRTSYGRFTQHSIEDIQGKQVMAVLNFEPRQMGPVVSECLVIGVQYPKAESGEATFVAPLVEAKLGSKLF